MTISNDVHTDLTGSEMSDPRKKINAVTTRKPSRYSNQMSTRARELRQEANSIWNTKLVKDPQGGHRTVSAASQMHDELQTQVDEEIEAGQDQHERQSRSARLFKTIAIWMDFFVLLYFMMGVFNVDIAHPFDTRVPLFVSLTFSLLATGITYTLFSTTGRRLRSRKSNRNTLSRKDIKDSATWLMLLFSVLLAIGVAVMMYNRVRTEVFDATDDASNAKIYAYIFASIIFFLACVIVYVEAFDGSALTERVDGLAKVIRKPMKKRQAMLDEADQLDGQVLEQVTIADHQK